MYSVYERKSKSFGVNNRFRVSANYEPDGKFAEILEIPFRFVRSFNWSETYDTVHQEDFLFIDVNKLNINIYN